MILKTITVTIITYQRMESMQKSTVTLPNDILGEILIRSDYDTIKALRFVNNHFRKILLDINFWKIKVDYEIVNNSISANEFFIESCFNNEVKIIDVMIQSDIVDIYDNHVFLELVTELATTRRLTRLVHILRQMNVDKFSSMYLNYDGPILTEFIIISETIQLVTDCAIDCDIDDLIKFFMFEFEAEFNSGIILFFDKISDELCEQILEKLPDGEFGDFIIQYMLPGEDYKNKKILDRYVEAGCDQIDIFEEAKDPVIAHQLYHSIVYVLGNMEKDKISYLLKQSIKNNLWYTTIMTIYQN